jgi:hypothetical protein
MTPKDPAGHELVWANSDLSVSQWLFARLPIYRINYFADHEVLALLTLSVNSVTDEK